MSKSTTKKYDAFSVVGWVLGGLSLLNMIEDLTPLKVIGKLKKWLDAYVSLVEQISEFLFGWIDFKWMRIDGLEIHVLMITLIVVTAYYRAEVYEQKKGGRDWGETYIAPLITASIYFMFSFIPALILPSWGGLLGAVVGLLFTLVIYFLPDDHDRGYAKGSVIFKELIGVGVVFLFLIVLNYTVF